MDDDDFWSLIAWLRPDEDQHQRFFDTTAKLLAERGTGQIEQFAEHLAQKLYALDTRAHAENLGEFSYEASEYFSDLVFLYIRCIVVARGRDSYNKVLADPTQMPKSEEEDYEPLTLLPAAAWEIATGEADHSFETSVSIETGSNKAGWTRPQQRPDKEG